MKITTIGIDLAKSVFQIHGVAAHGKTLPKKQIKRSEIATFFSNIPLCLIGMEAGSGHITGPVSRLTRGTRLSYQQVQNDDLVLEVSTLE